MHRIDNPIRLLDTILQFNVETCNCFGIFAELVMHKSYRIGPVCASVLHLKHVGHDLKTTLQQSYDFIVADKKLFLEVAIRSSYVIWSYTRGHEVTRSRQVKNGHELTRSCHVLRGHEVRFGCTSVG